MGGYHLYLHYTYMYTGSMWTALHMHLVTHTHTQTHTLTHTHPHTHTPTHSLSLAHTHTHTFIVTHTHTLTHTRAHTHSPPPPLCVHVDHSSDWRGEECSLWYQWRSHDLLWPSGGGQHSRPSPWYVGSPLTFYLLLSGAISLALYSSACSILSVITIDKYASSLRHSWDKAIF